MTPAQRMVRAKGWRWLPGMRTACGLRVYVSLAGLVIGVRDGDTRLRPETCAIPHDAEPDLTDPATLGAIEHGLLGPAGWYMSHDGTGGGRAWRHYGGGVLTWRRTLAEALADAVEALG